MTTVAAAGAASPSATAASMPVPDEAYAKDAMLAWFRGEFAAANAIIDSLCAHLAQIGGAEDYEGLFAAVHRRRLNWIPVIHMQKYYSVADVVAELRRVAANSLAAAPAARAPPSPVEPGKVALEEEEVDVVVQNALPPETEEEVPEVEPAIVEEALEVEPSIAEEAEAEAEAEVDECVGSGGAEEEAAEEESSGDSSDHKFTDDGEATAGSQGETASLENIQICTDHDECLDRPERIKIVKGFVAKEAVKGHMVNVVKGLKMYEDIFTESELLRLAEYINELRLAGRKGELSGETFIFFNKQIKGNKREIIQFGVPLFQPTNEEATINIEPIPPVLQTVIDHLVQWRLIPESRKPNSCIINFFEEDEHSQPYFKPPHFDNPISTLLLSETTMAFGRVLGGDHDGNYKGSLTLQIKEGSLLVMRGNSADMARHVVCASPNRRVSITFVRVRPANNNNQIDASSVSVSSPSKVMTLWQPMTPLPPAKLPAAAGVLAYGPHAMVPAAWGLALRAPVFMLAPPRPMPVNATSNNKKMPRSGTGVFLPWTVGPKKYTKHLPPRIQKRRLPSLPSILEAQA